MFIEMCFKDVEYHAFHLLEEKRWIRSLKEDVQICFQLEPDDSKRNLAEERAIIEALIRLEESIERRSIFLESLVDDFRTMTYENKEILEELNYQIKNFI